MALQNKYGINTDEINEYIMSHSVKLKVCSSFQKHKESERHTAKMISFVVKYNHWFRRWTRSCTIQDCFRIIVFGT